METMTQNNTFEKVMARLDKDRETMIVINRVPKDIRAEFISLAWAEEGGFAGDYGMLLKSLLDERRQLRDLSAIFLQLDNHEERLLHLEQGSQSQPPKQERKEIHLVSGKVIQKPTGERK